MSKINIDQKYKSIRKYAGRTVALEKQNYKTSKIAWGYLYDIMDIPHQLEKLDNLHYETPTIHFILKRGLYFFLIVVHEKLCAWPFAYRTSYHPSTILSDRCFSLGWCGCFSMITSLIWNEYIFKSVFIIYLVKISMILHMWYKWLRTVHIVMKFNVWFLYNMGMSCFIIVAQ